MAKLRIVALASIGAFAVASLSGCLQAQIQENQRQIAQQRAELDQMKQQIAALTAAGTATAPLPPGSCDKDVAKVAAKRGGERFAAGDFGHALGYYRDALTACPGSAQAELNLARTYEAMGERSEAITHYRNAAKGGGEGGDAGARQASDALSRLGVQ